MIEDYMKDNKPDNENKSDLYLDEPLSSPQEQDLIQPKQLTMLESIKQNLKNTYSSVPKLIFLIVTFLIIIIFIAIAVRTLTGTEEQINESREVQSPETPNDDVVHVIVSPEEALRRQQIANSEALAAAASGASYQPGFDINLAQQASNIDQGASDVHMDNTNIQFTPEQLAEMKRIEDDRKAKELARQHELSAWQKANDERNSYVEQQKAMVAENIASILGSNNSKVNNFSTSVSYLPANSIRNKETQNIPPSSNEPNTNKRIIFRTGNTIFAVLDSEVNTDSGNLAIATVYGGEYNGSKLIGQIAQGNDNIELKFNKLAPQDGRDSLSIDGIAMRMSDASTGVATSINKHTISRYASLLFSSALTGLGQAAQQQDSSVTQLNNGTTISTSHSATDKQIIGYVTGNMGSAITNEIGQNFNRKPTYKIARGTGVAVFMLSDVFSN
jgi:intracellular multiplication protein IcmE